MKKLIAIVLTVVLLSMGLAVVTQASPAITIYDQDRPGWEIAVPVYEEEFFTDATLNPGVSVVSDLGYVKTSTGVWWDRLVCPDDGLTTTTWQFDPPIIGFGGNWDPGVPGGPGARIAVAINGSWVDVGEIPETYTGQFWGFVSTVPFTQVRLEPGSNCNGAWCETYEVDNMVYSYGIVDIDIKPGSFPNSINTKSKGVIPVAILGSDGFDVTTVDVTTLAFGPNAATPAHDLTDPDHLQDVNGDDFTDLVSHYRTQETGIAKGDTEACLVGETIGGRAIHGCDSVLVRK